MPQTVLERTGGQVTETVGRAACATSRMGDAVRERLDEAKVFARRHVHRAEGFLDKGKTHIRRHPAVAITGSFSLGLGIGMLVGWTLRRK